MTTKPDNPQAFPTQETESNYGAEGMTLRDYFAGQALQVLRESWPRPIDKAIRAYELADAMLAERAKEQS